MTSVPGTPSPSAGVAAQGTPDETMRASVARALYGQRHAFQHPHTPPSVVADILADAVLAVVLSPERDEHDGWACTGHFPRSRYRVVATADGWDVYTQDEHGMVGS